MQMNKLLFVSLLIFNVNAFSQVTPPCGLDYGTTVNENNIINQMRYGTIANAVNAIDQGKNSRGNALGCAQTSVAYSTPNINEPTLTTIVNTWTANHVPAINAYTVNCARIARYENNAALGAYYAKLAGYYSNDGKLVQIADMMYDQQYATWNISNPDQRNEGVYGYLNVANTNSCYIGGVVGSGVTALCSTLPQYCKTFTNGLFTGNNFAISGQDDGSNWFDGGIAYDHGWAGIQKIESAIQQPSLSLKQKYRNSAALAGKYAISEYCVKNHNYTAKLIWLLSQLYAWTADVAYKNELNYKLDKSLMPGVLYDSNSDGLVDGTSPAISFTNLTSVAQTPGRMWDAHNSLPWYQAMNTWAMVEAYVAFRDQGDFSKANQLKPYAVAMLDNLANEVINKGVVTPDQLGVRDITYALLVGIWKISQYENETHLNWKNAAWAMWNSGYFNSYSTHSVCVGLYLIVRSNTPYQPLAIREAFLLNTGESENFEKKVSVNPNPVLNSLTIEIDSKLSGAEFELNDILGKVITHGTFERTDNKISINTDNLKDGVYLLKLRQSNSIIHQTKIIKVQSN